MPRQELARELVALFIVVGISAGASTADSIIEAVENALLQFEANSLNDPGVQTYYRSNRSSWKSKVWSPKALEKPTGERFRA